jgi:hypothetical protein
MTNRDLEVQNLNGNPFNYVLYDLNGHPQLTGKSDSDLLSLPLSNLPAGFYVLGTADQKSGQWYSSKVLLH